MWACTFKAACLKIRQNISRISDFKENVQLDLKKSKKGSRFM
jgi:hypothetical protein